MNRDEIEKRIESIKNEMEILKKGYSKLEGHLEEANHWLAQIVNSSTMFINDAESEEKNNGETHE